MRLAARLGKVKLRGQGRWESGGLVLALVHGGGFGESRLNKKAKPGIRPLYRVPLPCSQSRGQGSGLDIFDWPVVDYLPIFLTVSTIQTTPHPSLFHSHTPPIASFIVSFPAGRPGWNTAFALCRNDTCLTPIHSRTPSSTSISNPITEANPQIHASSYCASTPLSPPCPGLFGCQSLLTPSPPSLYSPSSSVCFPKARSLAHS
ncbi:hypothetical protein CGCF415_v003843 [Colletotrichum fructicola]|nr:hypothetical protein CGCF415_v003843 [Colletotrichum fructicola]KAF5487855.1 hypothetical protein CGCF413_v012489 [Colletotrichum fructicola]